MQSPHAGISSWHPGVQIPQGLVTVSPAQGTKLELPHLLLLLWPSLKTSCISKVSAASNANSQDTISLRFPSSWICKRQRGHSPEVLRVGNRTNQEKFQQRGAVSDSSPRYPFLSEKLINPPNLNSVSSIPCSFVCPLKGPTASPSDQRFPFYTSGSQKPQFPGKRPWQC